MIDIAGQRFGRLFALRPVAQVLGQGVYWYCLCSCGGTRLVLVALLRSGQVRSCGCHKRKRSSAKDYLFSDVALNCDRRAEYREAADEGREDARDQSLRTTSFRPGITQ